MITIEDCKAFCDANPDYASQLACEECLGMVQAYALAHEAVSCANDPRIDPPAAPLPLLRSA
jgi:hypothetical protein